MWYTSHLRNIAAVLKWISYFWMCKCKFPVAGKICIVWKGLYRLVCRLGIGYCEIDEISWLTKLMKFVEHAQWQFYHLTCPHCECSVVWHNFWPSMLKVSAARFFCKISIVNIVEVCRQVYNLLLFFDILCNWSWTCSYNTAFLHVVNHDISRKKNV